MLVVPAASGAVFTDLPSIHRSCDGQSRNCSVTRKASWRGMGAVRPLFSRLQTICVTAMRGKSSVRDTSVGAAPMRKQSASPCPYAFFMSVSKSPPPLAWTDARMAREHVGEMTLIRESACERDLEEGVRGARQQLLGLLDPALRQPGMRGHSGGGAERTGE